MPTGARVGAQGGIPKLCCCVDVDDRVCSRCPVNSLSTFVISEMLDGRVIATLMVLVVVEVGLLRAHGALGAV